MTSGYRPSLRDRIRVRARRKLLAHLRLTIVPAGTRLLDLGGGTGAATVVFGAGARELVVLEPDERKIARGTAAHTPVTFLRGVAESIPYGDGRFERVVSLMSFHHFSQPERALGEARRLLAPGGRFVLYDFDATTRRGRWVERFERRIARHSFDFASPEQLERMVTAAGFVKVHRESFGTGTCVIAEAS